MADIPQAVRVKALSILMPQDPDLRRVGIFGIPAIYRIAWKIISCLFIIKQGPIAYKMDLDRERRRLDEILSGRDTALDDHKGQTPEGNT